jgi:hypothetical protein
LQGNCHCNHDEITGSGWTRAQVLKGGVHEERERERVLNNLEQTGYHTTKPNERERVY